jgi:hypothetical protein
MRIDQKSTVCFKLIMTVLERAENKKEIDPADFFQPLE